MDNKKISIVVPIYNEVECLDKFIDNLDTIKFKYEIIFVCDPSTDGTEEKLDLLCKSDPERFKALFTSRRFGQHKCIIAGMQYTVGDAVIVMDVDGQDPIEVLPEMVRTWEEGYDVVYGKRLKRKKINFINKMTSKFGLFIISKLSYLDIPTGVGEFRIMDRKVVNEICKLNESSPFLRGMVAYVGFKQTSVEFIRPERYGGDGKYGKFIGSFNFGLNGLTSFSNKLLNFTVVLGILISFAAFLMGFAYMYFKINGILNFPIGNPTVVISILFMGGLQLFSIGILGIYIGKVHDQVSGRPNYIIKKHSGTIEILEN